MSINFTINIGKIVQVSFPPFLSTENIIIIVCLHSCSLFNYTHWLPTEFRRKFFTQYLPINFVARDVTFTPTLVSHRHNFLLSNSLPQHLPVCFRGLDGVRKRHLRFAVVSRADAANRLQHPQSLLGMLYQPYHLHKNNTGVLQPGHSLALSWCCFFYDCYYFQNVTNNFPVFVMLVFLWSIHHHHHHHHVHHPVAAGTKRGLWCCCCWTDLCMNELHVPFVVFIVVSVYRFFISRCPGGLPLPWLWVWLFCALDRWNGWQVNERHHRVHRPWGWEFMACFVDLFTRMTCKSHAGWFFFADKVWGN